MAEGPIHTTDNDEETPAAGTLGVDASAPQPSPKTMRWAPITSLWITFLVFMIFPCVCGYFDWPAIPFSVCAVAIAIYGWVASKAKFPGRLLHVAAVILALLLLAKIVGDVLWFGHHPLGRWLF